MNSINLSNITILPITADDIPEVSLAERDIFSSPWSRESFEDVLKFPFLGGFCARLNGELAGYGIYHVLFEDGEILNIATLKSFRKMGIAKKLMAKMEEEIKLRGGERIMLEVRQSNQGAKNLYTALGFEITGNRKNYYKNPTENAILMEKSLN